MRLGATFPACALATRRVSVSIDCAWGYTSPVVSVLSQPGWQPAFQRTHGALALDVHQ